MKNLLKAIMTKTTTPVSALSTYVGGRVYLDEAPEGVVFPYVVFFIVSGVPDRTFTERYTDTLIQFSLFSTSSGAMEITTMYANLKTLFDECALTIPPTGLPTDTLVWMRESNLTTMVDDITTLDGTVSVKHWAVDYEIRTSLN